MWAIVSLDRPTTKSIAVNVAVRKGEENDEKNVAMPATIATSQTVSAAAAVTSCRSSGEGAARIHATPRSATAHGTRTKTRVCRARTSMPTRMSPMSRTAVPTFHAGCPVSRPSISRTAAASTHTKTMTVIIVPTYLPTRYSQRRMGRERIGKIVLSSSSRWSDVDPSATATSTA